MDRVLTQRHAPSVSKLLGFFPLLSKLRRFALTSSHGRDFTDQYLAAQDNGSFSLLHTQHSRNPHLASRKQKSRYTGKWRTVRNSQYHQSYRAEALKLLFTLEYFLSVRSCSMNAAVFCPLLSTCGTARRYCSLSLTHESFIYPFLCHIHAF